MQIFRNLSILAVAFFFSQASARDYNPPILEHVYDNGLRLLVIERPGEHRVTGKIFTDMGALNEKPGEFGAAHFLEHVMFKGTPTLGSLDWEREKEVHAQIRAAEDALIEELNRSRNDLRERGVFHDYQHSSTTPRIEELRALIDSLNAQAQELSEEGPMKVWYQAYGGTRSSATTEQEYMKFDLDLPADRVELYLRVEADRMQNSIFRNFDAERMVLVEQRLGDLNRAETEFREAMNSLVGRASMVYVPEGYMNDFDQYTRRYERELKVEKYFGHMERAPEPHRYQGREPLPSGEKRLNWRSDTLASRVEVRYQIPGVGHPDRPLFDVLAEAFEAQLQSVVSEAGISGTVDINTRVVHTSRFGVPASINIELVLQDASQVEEAEATLLAELGRLAEEPLAAGGTGRPSIRMRWRSRSGISRRWTAGGRWSRISRPGMRRPQRIFDAWQASTSLLIIALSAW
jgi:predicted Zn-dependent peptidase